MLFFNGNLSEEFSINRGVRQGCPLSPILFNLFINDILDNCDKYGVNLDSQYCCGGLFSDDIVLDTPSKLIPKKIVNKVHEWAIQNEITFGINKCATLVVVKLLNFVKPINYEDPSFFIGSVNAENAVRQASRANASEGEDHNFFQIVN